MARRRSLSLTDTASRSSDGSRVSFAPGCRAREGLDLEFLHEFADRLLADQEPPELAVGRPQRQPGGPMGHGTVGGLLEPGVHLADAGLLDDRAGVAGPD